MEITPLAKIIPNAQSPPFSGGNISLYPIKPTVPLLNLERHLLFISLHYAFLIYFFLCFTASVSAHPQDLLTSGGIFFSI